MNIMNQILILKYFYVCFVIFVLLVSATVAFAVGGGGGGSLPSCDADQWDCTGWSQCSSSGIQTRICSLTFDCSTADTPKPNESQSCTPPPSPPSTEPAPPQSSEPAEEKTEPKAPSCTRDSWACGAWSASCDSLGREQRSCKLSFDCPGVETPPPASTQPCQKLQCGNKPTVRDRIFCRLNLAPAGVARELQIQYLPEACRTDTGDEKKKCINLYKSFGQCWSVKEANARFSCARNILKLGPVISEEIKTCQWKKGADQVACKADIKEKVLYMILFRFYDLETRAEELGNRGADLETIADFETMVEIKKQEFKKAKTNAERLKIILDVRRAWREFINKVKDQVK